MTTEDLYTTAHGKTVTKGHLELLQIYWTCAYMKRTPDDKSCFKEFASKYGVLV